jgi:hypothetical protein
MPSACRSFCFDTTSSGTSRFRAVPADSIDVCRTVSVGDTRRALMFCNPHLASAPKPLRRTLGKGIYDWLTRFSEAKTRTARISSISSLSRVFEQNL